MCGIAGTYLWPDGGPITERMTDDITHRGPDASGRYRHELGAGEVHLGHRRLSIVDLTETGAQPMVLDGLVLTYNGEIYNAPELRTELESAGVRFRGTSDTEVLLQAWRVWGRECLPRLRGMFAFAILDERTGELVLARDQLGIKPLFLLRRGAGLAFCSELKALAAHCGPLEIDDAALVASLLYYWVPDTRCAYRDAEKLAPGSWLAIRPDGAVTRGTYWSLREEAEKAAHAPYPDLAAIVEDSTRRHLMADVPVATFLSGGLDSSYLTALAAKHQPGISAYTIGFRAEDAKFEAMPDDLRYARQVAKQFGVELNEIEIAPDVLDLLPLMTHHLDEPIGDPAAINSYLICTAAREAGVKVMLSGMGADELFGGYRKHAANMLASRYQQVPAALRRPVHAAVDRMPVASAKRGYRSVRFAKRFLSFADLPEETAFRRSYTMYDRAELLRLVNPDLAPAVDDVLAEHTAIYDDQALGDRVNRMCLADSRMFLPGLNLTYTDRSTMAASVEVRVPFVDIEVVKAAFAVPGNRKIVGRAGKMALKEAALSILPKEIVHRPKGLFSAPLRAWMSRDLAPLVAEVIESGELVNAGFLNRDALRALVAEDKAGQEDRSKHLWHVLTLEYWYRGALERRKVGSVVKQVVQNYKSGELAVVDVPVPTCKRGGVLVRTRFSLISTGTEMMKVTEASLSMVGKAKARPDQVAKVVQTAATLGPVATYRKVVNKLDSWTPLGYSLAGEVIEVGEGVDDVAVGDIVACAGNEHALHAELNWVPKHLYTRVPDGVDPRHAAFGTVGSIAMQGVRQGEPALGELALVIGLGLIGQLVVQLLVASGVRVVGVDPDPARCALAEQLGALVCSDPGSGVVDTAVGELSSGHGVDQVYLAAGGSSNDPVELAAKLARDRGRVIDIGKCRLDLPWNAYYEKELDVRFSRSYGPGRYDPSYELEGRDYPIGYVRWTERRNLECFLDLVARKRVDVGPLISRVAEFDTAVETYGALKSGDLKAVAVLFDYPATDGAAAQHEAPAVVATPVPRPGTTALRVGRAGLPLRVAFVGAGNYASSMLLPHLNERDDVTLSHVVTTSALSAANAKRKFGFASATTELDPVLDDPAVDAVFVVTRHNSHAALTARALRAGKAVFVEKPLALDEAELSSVLDAVAESGNDRLQVGFNRRFAPLLREAKQQLGRRVGPATVRYLVNAGPLEHGSWYARSDSEGSRFVGEGGHFVDTVSWLLGVEPESVYACSTPGRGDLQVSVRYADGSTAVITYAESGAPGFPKETLDLMADSKVLKLDDFQRVSVVRGRKAWTTPRIPLGRDKGQAAQLDAFLDALRGGRPMPIGLDSLAATHRVTFAVHASLATGGPVPVAAPVLDEAVLNGAGLNGAGLNGTGA